MKTTFEMRQPWYDIFHACARDFVCDSPARPVRFIQTLRRNRGSIGTLTGLGYDAEGLELKNPLIVGLGDSVTAGHFEGLESFYHRDQWLNDILRLAGMRPDEVDLEALDDPERAERVYAMLGARIGEAGFPPLEITDCRQSYLEKFRQRLIDKYEFTSVSAVNAGIAGDHLIMMEKRLTRDVIRYQPDLALINGSLNWADGLGSTADYKAILTRVVRRVKAETEADVILLTPNGMVGDEHACETLDARVRAIREVAAEEEVCLADAYAVWVAAREKGCPWGEMLANGVNHPSPLGHEVYAEVLMKLVD